MRETLWDFLNIHSRTEFCRIMIGLTGQLLFSMRFLIQWIQSERSNKSVIPISFWYFSLAGGVVLLAYGLWRREPVIILGQLPGTFIYIRNLCLIYTEKQ